MWAKKAQWTLCHLDSNHERPHPPPQPPRYLGVLFLRERTMEPEMRRTVVLRLLYCTVVTKRALSQRAKFSIYQSIFIATLTYGHEEWVMTERIWLALDVGIISLPWPGNALGSPWLM